MARAHYSADELFAVCVKWVNLFDLAPTPIKNVFELSDGVVIFKLLCQLSPTYFDITSINTSPHNRYSKNSNIIELKQCLEQFFNDVLDEDIAIDKMIDHNQITSNDSYGNNDHLRMQHYVRMLEMVLLCAIKCENKKQTINQMTSLTMVEQATLMNILQTLMSNTGFDVKQHDNNNENKNNQNVNSKASEKNVQTPKSNKLSKSSSFRRLSMSQYSASSNKTRSCLLSPFGSKTKKKSTKIASDLSNHNKNTLNFGDDTHLKKDNMKLHENNMNLNKELESSKKENKELSKKYFQLKHDFNTKQEEFQKEISNKYKKSETVLKIEIESNKENIRKYEEEIRYNNDEINEYKKALIQLQEENNKFSVQLQDIDAINDTKLRHLRDDLDIAQHQSGKYFEVEKQVKTYKIRLESMNDLQDELTKYKTLYAQKCDTMNDLELKMKIIPSLKQQIEKYKKQMIEYKVASIGAIGVGHTLHDKQIANKLANLEESVVKLNQENEELNNKLKTSRIEIIDLQSKNRNQSNDNIAFLGSTENNNAFLGGITPELQSKISKLQSENKRLHSLANSKHTMNDLMDELDTKTRLLQSTETKYEKTQKILNCVSEELETMKTTTAEWMRNSCSPQQYDNTLKQLKDLEGNVNEKNKYIDQLREDNISSTAKIKEYENELNRTKQRYRDLYEYTEKQKMRLGEYKKAISEMHSIGSNEKKNSFQTQKYFDENRGLKEDIKNIKQEMECVQNACMHLLKREVLMNNNMLSKPSNHNNALNGLNGTRESKSNSTSPNIQNSHSLFINTQNRGSTFSFGK